MDGFGEAADPAPTATRPRPRPARSRSRPATTRWAAARGQEQPRRLVDVTAGGTVQGTNWRADGDQHGRRLYLELHAVRQPAHPHRHRRRESTAIATAGWRTSCAGEAFAVSVTDNEGDVSTETTLDITVNDDGPTANNDLATQATRERGHHDRRVRQRRRRRRRRQPDERGRGRDRPEPGNAGLQRQRQLHLHAECQRGGRGQLQLHDHGRRRRHLDGDGFDHACGGFRAERDGERRDG